MENGQKVWVQGKKAIVSHTDEHGDVWVTFETSPTLGAFAYPPDQVCPRTEG